MGENEIRNLADSHAGIDEWKKAGFNELQVLEITKGNDNGVDISIYASPEYNSRQMKVIRMALEEGIDVSAMADPAWISHRLQITVIIICRWSRLKKA